MCVKLCSKEQGGIPPLRVNAQRRGSDVVLISGRDAFLTYLLFKPYKYVPPRAQAVSGILQAVHDVQLNNTVGRLITFPLCAVTAYALQTITWLRATIKQVCHLVDFWAPTDRSQPKRQHPKIFLLCL